MSNWTGVVEVFRAAWRRWRGRSEPDPALVIRPPVQKFSKLSASDYETARARAAARREIAAARYRQGRSNGL